MPIYHKLGEIPRKRHMVFRRPGGALYMEELMGNYGFQGPSTLAYHLHRPTEVMHVRELCRVSLEPEPEPLLRHRHFRTRMMKTGPDVAFDRVPLLFNSDVIISAICPRQQQGRLYRNGQADEIIYVAEGEGVLESMLGELPFRAGDYVVIPRGIVHRWRIEAETNRFLVVESAGFVRTPKRYRNEFGQLLEHAPYCERDIRRPEKLTVHEETGKFAIVVRKGQTLQEILVRQHPFDVVGWDGYYYPWAFNIHDFEPRVGRFHLPPPLHQTFEGDGFVVCSFCPRPYDFDPQAVPAPYNHSNVMSDEVLYYANEEFMSRKGIEYGSITLHPDGLPHGPHPGRTEESIGKTRTDELAVMIDTFRSLQVTRQALAVEDPDYFRSWLE